MSATTDELRDKAQAYRIAIFEMGDAREERDAAKRALKETEASIFAAKTQSGTIDGKNAETRDAQAQLAFKADTTWQYNFDRFIEAEKAFYQQQDMLTIALMELKVAATLVNAEIAQTGATRLLSEVSLAGA